MSAERYDDPGLRPPGMSVGRIRAADKATLRVAAWRTQEGCAGTVCVLPGRGEFIEKYYEVVAELLGRGFDVVVMDWRGQGGSTRQADHPAKGHIDDFSAYQRDLEALRVEALEPYARRPFYALAHSMGGAILLDAAHAGRCFFERVATTAPMIDLCRLRYARALRGLARSLCVSGLAKAFAPGAGGPKPYPLKPFAGNPITSDPGRYARMGRLVAASPEIAVGAPTVGWVDAAFRLMWRFENPDFAREIFEPFLIVAAGDDRVVDTPAIETFAARMKAGRCVTLRGARHEILMERDPIRAQFWAAFDAFIPGAPAQGARAPDAAAAAGGGAPVALGS
ncbi:alpha/beta fold hydrolase [Methylocella sp.]|uniref:alpha/beta fold hydrolase n=1 Tax=Methylocella sp. TaxID=1978226 RepID=UPI003784226B